MSCDRILVWTLSRDSWGQLGPSLLKVLPLLDERSRRLVLGMAAKAEGKGGTGRVASLTGASWQTVANGKAELASEEELPPGRARRPGGGRKRLAESDPGLAAELEKLIRDAMRGDPESPLVWTTRSAEHLESGTFRGRLCCERGGVRCAGEASVPAVEVAGELVVEDPGTDLE